MILYKKRQIIAAAVLIPIILILLLSLNFRIWSGNYIEGDLESIVVQQMDGLENTDNDEDMSEKTFLRFYECVCLSGMDLMIYLLCEMSSGVPLKAFSHKPGTTLQSLAVRMDN